MEAAEGIALLTAVAEIDGADRAQDADIALLVTDLGRLPLALSHAGAYIQQMVITVREYRQEYADSLLDSQATLPIDDPYQQAVASTWSISIAAVEAKAAAAGIPPLGRLLLTGCGVPEPGRHPTLVAKLRWLAGSAAGGLRQQQQPWLAPLRCCRGCWPSSTASPSSASPQRTTRPSGCTACWLWCCGISTNVSISSQRQHSSGSVVSVWPVSPSPFHFDLSWCRNDGGCRHSRSTCSQRSYLRCETSGCCLRCRA